MTEPFATPSPHNLGAYGVPDPSKAALDAIVYVSGLARDEYMAPAHIAQLLCFEMGLRATDLAATFAVEPSSVGAESVMRIIRTDTSGRRTVADVYSLKPEAFFDTASGSHAVGRVFGLALTVFAGILVCLGLFTRPNRKAKSPAQTLQIFTALGIMLILGIYFLLALWALIGVALVAVGYAQAGQPLIIWPQWIVVVASVTGALAPGLRQKIEYTAESFLNAFWYVRTAGMRNRLTGALQALIARINTQPPPQGIHVIGYSFGSLVSIDTLFPNGVPNPPPVHQIRSLTTIGCPFDLVRMITVQYAKDRRQAASGPVQWLNIYQPIDVFASNFGDGRDDADSQADGLILANDGGVRRPDVNIPWGQTRLNLIDVLIHRSLTSHGQYWDNTMSVSVFGEVVTHLYAGTEVLR